MSAAVQEGGSGGKLLKRSCHFAVVPGGTCVEGGKPNPTVWMRVYLPLVKDKAKEAHRGNMVFTRLSLDKQHALQ